MFSNIGKWGVAIAAVAGTAVLGATPAQAAAPVCYPKEIKFPNNANAQFQVTESFVLQSCFDADGDTLHVTSPSLPYVIYIYPGGYTTPSGPFVHTVTDGHGNTTTQTLVITRG